MKFAFWDYLVMAVYVIFMVGVGVIAKRKGQESLEDYFTGGKNLPWWLIGISMLQPHLPLLSRLRLPVLWPARVLPGTGYG